MFLIFGLFFFWVSVLLLNAMVTWLCCFVFVLPILNVYALTHQTLYNQTTLFYYFGCNVYFAFLLFFVLFLVLQ